MRLPRVVSLFCGAGGLDLGFQQAGFSVAVAFDSSPAAVRSHHRNFGAGVAIQADLVALGPAGVLAVVRRRIPRGARIGVIGGPPCQGFSRANTTSHESDPRNELAALYVEVVRALQASYRVEFVVLENVPGIRDLKHAAQYAKVTSSLSSLGLRLAERELCALDFGVPQKRHRLLVSGMREDADRRPSEPHTSGGGRVTVQDAIGHISEAPAFFRRNMEPQDIPLHPNHWTMRPVSKRFFRPGESSNDGRSFKRLRWDAPSPTVAYGHREIHVHPDGLRRLSIYEALLLQGFPESFVLEGNLSEQVEQVSNAVPPPLARGVAMGIRSALGQCDG